MQKIHDEQNIKSLNKNHISITDFSFCLRLQYGLAQHFLLKLLISCSLWIYLHYLCSL